MTRPWLARKRPREYWRGHKQRAISWPIAQSRPRAALRYCSLLNSGPVTVRELEKCFNGQGCFGPNNTVVVTLRNAFKDLTKGPSKDNEIVTIC